ncbi:MAG: FISUMP domain-containing protein [Bacteroidota bacterium]
MKYILILLTPAILLLSCSKNSPGEPNTQDSTFTDIRDGQVYTFSHFGSQVWMTQNLNYVIDSSWCYDNNSENCDTFGRLYNWDAAMNAAPAGWHLPSYSEWQTLTAYLGGNEVAGGAMKDTILWSAPNTGGTNSSGFRALPGGRSDYPSFDYVYKYMLAEWWSSTEVSTYATAVSVEYRLPYALGYTGYKSIRYSVRCIRN